MTLGDRLEAASAALVALLVVTSTLVVFVGAGAAYEPDVFLGDEQDARSISYGETITSEIDENDPQYDGDPAEPITFDGTAGDFVVIDAEAMWDAYSEANDMEIYLVDPSGDEIANDDDSGVGNSVYNSRIGIELPQSGTYTIQVTAHGDLMEYSLTLRNVDIENLRSISYGETLYGEIDDDDPRDSNYEGYHEPVTFSGTLGSYVLIDQQTLDNDGDTELWLVAPNGTVMASDDDSGIGGDDYNSRIGFELGSTGTYTIIAGSSGTDELLNYSLSVQNVNLQSNLRSISYGETRYGRINPGDPSDSDFEGLHEPVTFQGSVNDFVAIEEQTMTSEGDTRLWLVDPSGDEVEEDDDDGVGGDGYNSRIGYTLQESGEYTIIAGSYGDDEELEYTLTIEVQETERDLRSIEYNEILYGQVDDNDPSDSDYEGYHEPITFNGSAGDEIIVDQRTLTYEGDTELWLLDPDGTELDNDDDGGLGGDEYNSRIRYTLTENGTHTIIAGSSGTDELLTYGLRLIGPSEVPVATSNRGERFEIVDVEFNETRIEAGDAVEITVDVANTGGRDGTYRAILSADLRQIETQRATIEEGTIEQFTFVTRFEEPSTNRLFLRTKFLGTVYVRPPDETISTVFQSGQNDDDLTIDVQTARRDVGLFLGLPATGSGREAGVAFDGITITTTSDMNYTLDISQSRDTPVDFPDLPAGTRTLLFADVTTNLTAADIESAVFEFTIQQSQFAGAEPENVVLYHWDGNRLRTLETEIVAETDTTITFRATADRFSVFGIAVQTADIAMFDAALSADTLTAGDSVDVTATAINDGAVDGTVEVALTVDGQVAATQRVTVPAGESRTVSFTQVFEDAGEFGVAIGNADAGTVTVESMVTETPESTPEPMPESTPTPDESMDDSTPTESGGDTTPASTATGTTDASGPGFGIGLAIAGLLALAGFALRRRP